MIASGRSKRVAWAASAILGAATMAGVLTVAAFSRSVKIGLPLMTDESSLTPEDIPGLWGCVDGINIKLVKCGGLRQALKMIHLARACGMKIMLGCKWQPIGDSCKGSE